MKYNCALFFFMLGAAVAVQTCFQDENKCTENECCMQIGSVLAGACVSHFHNVKNIQPIRKRLTDV
jgi:hypothetical protein